MEEKTKPSKQAERSTKSMKVAVFCIAALIILYIGSNFLRGLDLFSKKTFYYSISSDAGGIHASAPLFLNGYKIGKVTKVHLLCDNPVKILTEYLLNEDVRIPKDSRFEIMAKDLMGGLMVQLSLGVSTELAAPGDTLISVIVPQLTDGINEMKDQIASILASVDTIAFSLKDVFANQNGSKNLAKILENLENSTSTLDKILTENKENAKKLVDNITKFSKTLNDVSPELKSIVSNFDQIADSLAKTNVAAVIVNANNAILQVEEVVKKVNNGDGDVAKLLNNDALYSNLNASLESINKLIIDIRENPKKYINVTIFGKKEKAEKPK